MNEPSLQIEPRHWAIVSTLLRRHVPRCEVWAFGSRAAGRAKPYSDLDLVVVGDGEVPFSIMAALTDDLEHSDLPFKVDVLDWALLTPAFREVIEASRVRLQSPAAAGAEPGLAETGRRA